MASKNAANSCVLSADMCRREIRHADDLRYAHPRHAVVAARRALRHASALKDHGVGESEWLCLQADAWAVLGSALRGTAELREAEGAFNIALAFLEDGKLQPLRCARLAQRAAILRFDQRRFAER